MVPGVKASASRALPLVGFLVASLHFAPTRSAAQAPEDAYRTLVNEAVAEQSAGNFGEAYALFERAHALNPNARTARALAAMAFELRRYPEAVDWAEFSLASQVRPLTEEQRVEVGELLARAELRVGTLEISIPPGAELYVDGVRVELDDGKHVVSVGTHRLEARLPDGRRAAEEVPVGAQESREVALVPAPLGATGGPVVGSRDEGPNPAWAIGWTSFGLTAVGAGVGVAGYLIYEDAVQARMDSTGCEMPATAEIAARCQKIDDDEQFGTNMILAGSILGGTFFVAGITLVVVGRPRGRTTSSAVRCAPGLASFGCSGTF